MSPTENIMSFFPLPKARGTQELLIKKIEEAFSSGKKFVVLEAPVGSGKSAIALTLARHYGQAHILTPRKGLQDQYFDDFQDYLALMMGRSSYPCVIESTHAQRTPIYKAIENGRTPAYPALADSCATAPCVNSETVYKLCTSDKKCPYTYAMEIAQSTAIVVHNLHSFLYQTNYGEKFQQRPILIVDEAHELEGMVRDFITREIILRPRIISPELGTKIQLIKDEISAWGDFLLQEDFLPQDSTRDERARAADPEYMSPRDVYLGQVASLCLSFEKRGFSTEVSSRTIPGQKIEYTIRFVPHTLGAEPSGLIFNFGEKVLLMSGTIYNLEQFCNTLGIPKENAEFLRIGSSFPVENRPIYCRPDLQVNTSHAEWRSSLPTTAELCEKISKTFHDVKGLIHTPSYSAGVDLVTEIGLRFPELRRRLRTHVSSDFADRLKAFYEEEGNPIFVSPVCQQGVDFKEDRARFQIITRIPYPSIGNRFVKHQLENNYQWYNYQALIVWGQQIGRINRSEKDFGATFLLDSRFGSFISKNRSSIPAWVRDAIIWR